MNLLQEFSLFVRTKNAFSKWNVKILVKIWTTQPLLNTIIQNTYKLVQYDTNEKIKYHLNEMATICYMRMCFK